MALTHCRKLAEKPEEKSEAAFLGGGHLFRRSGKGGCRDMVTSDPSSSSSAGKKKDQSGPKEDLWFFGTGRSWCKGEKREVEVGPVGMLKLAVGVVYKVGKKSWRIGIR